MKLPYFLRALAQTNYRRYFIGQGISLLGNWMTTTAALWLVYRLSGSAFAVGLVGFASQVPVLILAPFAGVFVDRVDSRKLVWWTQVLAMLQSAALAAATFTGHLTVAVLVGLCFLQGLINAVDWPARQTLTFRLAGGRDFLDNVIALNSITFNLARLVGPAVAGFVIAARGPGFCFALDAASYLAVLVSLHLARLEPHRPREARAHPLADFREGLDYAWHHPSIRRILLMASVIALVGFAHSILAPIFARDIYHGDARTLGFLMSATGVGSVAAGIFLGSRRSAKTLEHTVTWGAALGGVGLVACSIPGPLALALVSFAAAGAGGVLVMATSNTLVQGRLDDAKRGRVMGLFTMAQSMFPIGSLIVGAVAEALGAGPAMLGCGLVALLAAGVFGRTVNFFSAPRLDPAELRSSTVRK